MVLWNALRNRRLDGFKFRRQYPVDRWIIDFFCLEKMAVVEIDGPVHRTRAVREYDRLREEYLGRMGIRILRMEMGRIENDPPWVLNDIREFLVR